MNPLRIFLSVLFGLLLFSLVPPARSQVNPPPISWRYQGYVETQEWWLEHETLPGWHYLVEESQDLAVWTPMAGGFCYGDGGTKRHFITNAPVPVPSDQPPPPPPDESVSKSFRQIQWEVTLSADPNSSLIHIKRLPMPDFPAWDKVLDLPLPRLVHPEVMRLCYFLDYEDEDHDIWCEPKVYMPTAARPQPSDTLPTAGEHEEFELAVFQSIVNQLTAYLSTPFTPAQPDTTPRPHKFVRIRRTMADSNHNAIPDWQEMQYGFPVFTAGISGAADADGDGRTNAQEMADGTDPRAADAPEVRLVRQFNRESVHQCLTAGVNEPIKEETATNGAQTDDGPSSGVLDGQSLPSIILNAHSSFPQVQQLIPFSTDDYYTATLVAYTSGRYTTGENAHLVPANSYGNSFTSMADAETQKFEIKLQSTRPPPRKLERFFLPLTRNQPVGVTLGSNAPITNWNHVKESVKILSLLSTAGSPAESAVTKIPRPSIQALDNGKQIRTERTLAEISLRADTSRNGTIGLDDYHLHRAAVYTVNYDHDEARTNSSGHPTEDAVKWTATDDGRHSDGEPLRKLRPADENWEIKVTPTNAENLTELAPLRIAPVAFGTPDLKVFLTLPPEDEVKVKAFHLYLVKTNNANTTQNGVPPGGKSYHPIWGGCNVDSTATSPTAAPHAIASAPIKFTREVDITKFINPSAPGYVDYRSAGVPGNMQPLYEFALEGILFKGMPYPGADGYARYGPSTNPEPVFNGILKIGLFFRTGTGTTMATTTAIPNAESWATLTCAPSIPLDEDGDPAPIADLLAFKGNTPETTAQGYGKHALGGRYGHTFTVTTISDDPNHTGSLRYAINAPVPRTIVFALNSSHGTIELGSPLFVRDRQCTIAGQTAFQNGGNGICLKNYGLRVTTDDVIVRHLRSRPGPVGGSNADSFSAEELSHNVIFDRCSASFSNDALIDVATGRLSNGGAYYTRPNRKITVQNCLMAWPLNRNLHVENGQLQNHGYGSTIRIGHGGKVTFWRNLYAHCLSRCARPGGTVRSQDDPIGLQFDFVNNVIFGWGDQGNQCVEAGNDAGYDDGDSTQGDGIGKYNLLGNYYRGRLNNLRAEKIDNVWTTVSGAKKWFRIQNTFVKANLTGNRIKTGGGPASSFPPDQYHGDFVEYNPSTMRNTFNSAPSGGYPSGVHTTPITEAIMNEQSVRAKAGASLRRDALDLKLLDANGMGGEYQARAGTIIDNPAQVGGWPVLKTAETTVKDFDGDGIPNDREPVTAGRTSPWNLDPRNAALDDDRDGYTNFEEFLNSIAE